VAQVAGEVPISFAELDSAGKVILSGAMILGRLEMLAIIALLNPEFWRQ
jgi:trk system potassium uptake protein TrkH